MESEDPMVLEWECAAIHRNGQRGGRLTAIDRARMLEAAATGKKCEECRHQVGSHLYRDRWLCGTCAPIVQGFRRMDAALAQRNRAERRRIQGGR